MRILRSYPDSSAFFRILPPLFHHDFPHPRQITAGYVPELELRSVMAEQVMQIKNYAVPGPKFAPKMAGNWKLNLPAVMAIYQL